ncbi:hypothetical protein [Frankia sp. R82]|nr:hypothetical protein [Frankia sp. R82]MCM3886665.1 hypothetical protein [Frankia sp. R82]
MSSVIQRAHATVFESRDQGGVATAARRADQRRHGNVIRSLRVVNTRW